MSRSSSLTSNVVTVITTVILLRVVWTSIPNWVKRRRNRATAASRGAGEDELVAAANAAAAANDDFASPDVLLTKLYQLMELVSKLCADLTPDDIPWYKMNLCFFSYLHLQQELCVVDPYHRHEAYRKEGDEVSTEELENYVELLDLAHWAYRSSGMEVEANLRAKGYRILRHDTSNTEPGRVGHYMAVHHEQRTILIAIKGTNTVADVLTDVVGDSFDFDLDRPFAPYASTHLRCHEGMLIAAQLLADDVQHMLEAFFLPQGYNILLCGHSLGAGVACLTGVLLKSRLAEAMATKYGNKDSWLRVVAFATPACMDVESAQACAPFITSVVNNTDCVPRLSIINVLTMNKLLLQIDQKLNERGMQAYDLASAMKLLADLSTFDGNLLMTREEIDDVCKQVRETKSLQDYLLMVPGRVVYLWETEMVATTGDADGTVADTATETTAVSEPSQSPQGNSNSDNTDTTTPPTPETNEADAATAMTTPTPLPATSKMYARSHHGGMCALRQIELDTSMILDHLAFRYKGNLVRIVEQRKQEARDSATMENVVIS